MLTFMRLASLCLLSLAIGCGGPKTENPQADGEGASTSKPHRSSLDAPYSALADHPQFELSDLQFPSPNSFTVRWRVTSGKASGSWTLAIKPGGNSIPTSLSVRVWDENTTGEISGELRAIGFDSGPSLESGCEMFLTVQEGGHTFKISNSVTAGSASTTSPHPPSSEVIAQVEQHRQQSKQQREQRWQQEAAQKAAQQNAATDTASPNPPQPENRDATMSRPPGMALVPSGMPIPNGTQLMAQEGNRWLLVTVVGDRADGSLNVHWEGNTGKPDEFLPRAKLAIESGRLARIRADYVRSKRRRP